MADVQRVIVDVDVGIDDYMALLLLFFAHKTNKLKIEAIFCTNGNTKVDHVCTNVVRLLETIDQTNIPVFKGTQTQIIVPKDPLPIYNGEDGFGDLTYDSQPDLSIISDLPSAIGFRNIISENPNEITLICLGPLTNLALSIKLFEDVAPNIKELWIMGGNYAGNGDPAAAEYNFLTDPEAAHIVLEYLKCPMYVVPWETCLLPNISYEWFYSNFEGKSDALDLLVRAENSSNINEPKFMPSDAFTAFAFLNPEKHIAKRSSHFGFVELENPRRGEIILDDSKDPNIVIVEQIDEELFKEYALNIINV